MLVTREFSSSLVVYDERTYENKEELRLFLESKKLEDILSSVENAIIVL